MPRCLWDAVCQIKLKSMNSSISSSLRVKSEPPSNISKKPKCLPVSNQFDSRAASPEDMQSALSLYKASAALTNMQVQSCSMWKGFSMMLWLEKFRLCNFWFSFWCLLSSSGNFARGKIGRSWKSAMINSLGSWKSTSRSVEIQPVVSKIPYHGWKIRGSSKWMEIILSPSWISCNWHDAKLWIKYWAC